MAGTPKEINIEMIELGNLRIMVEAYEEVAISRMRKIRDSVLKTRNFIADIVKILQEVRFSYRAEIFSLLKKKKIKGTSTMSMIKKNGKHVSILLSSNTGLYGDIVRKTFDLFQKNVRDGQSDIIIIGRLGKALFEANNPGVPITYFDFPDSGVDREKIHLIIDNILSYDKVLVFYGQFENIISQQSVIMDIYGNSNLLNEESVVKTKYLFEPSLENIYVFFEKQIFSSIFEQAVHESDLAKYASRMVSLDLATDNINKRLNKISLLKRISEHRIFNKKQINALLGVSLWGNQA